MPKGVAAKIECPRCSRLVGGTSLTIHLKNCVDFDHQLCTTCRVSIPIAEFHVRAASVNGRAAQCRPCKVEHSRNSKLLSKYGITHDDYEAMLRAQGGTCAFDHCESTGSGPGPGLVVDHDHETNVVRGLLCHQHNVMLGYGHDSTVELLDGVQYLLRSRYLAH